ncbi:hypothetical protein ACIO1C_00130 [Streptomyces sp. NPDC087420]|uniref:hypothetical protein n=1 Tax=Streptomyces sp. NPDC087420 TaxID=3365785 RepID=UPI0038378AF8
MKLRNGLAVTLATLALTLSMSTSALAATGQFHYKFRDDSGQELSVTLPDPRSGRCINLYGVDSDDLPPGYAPHNQTDAGATVYDGIDCEGREWRLRPHGLPAGDRLLVRSVRFEDL